MPARSRQDPVAAPLPGSIARIRAGWLPLRRLIGGGGLMVVTPISLAASGADVRLAARSRIHIDGDIVTVVDLAAVQADSGLIERHFAQVRQDYDGCIGVIAEVDRLLIKGVSVVAAISAVAGFDFGYIDRDYRVDTAAVAGLIDSVGYVLPVPWDREVVFAVMAAVPVIVVGLIVRLGGWWRRPLIRGVRWLAARFGR
jgi:hypothetical protein